MPYVLRSQPRLLGYYRLLLCFSQKQFYGERYGFAPFKPMEEKGSLTANHEAIGYGSSVRRFAAVPSCSLPAPADCREIWSMNSRCLRWVHSLRGSVLNVFGSRATRRVFELIESMVGSAIVSSSQNASSFKMPPAVSSGSNSATTPTYASGKNCHQENSGTSSQLKSKAAWITRISTIASGRAEKSHQKARKDGYVECWTIVGVVDLNVELAGKESPSTDRFYYLDRITDRKSEEFDDFRENLLSRVGIEDYVYPSKSWFFQR